MPSATSCPPAPSPRQATITPPAMMISEASISAPLGRVPATMIAISIVKTGRAPLENTPP